MFDFVEKVIDAICQILNEHEPCGYDYPPPRCRVEPFHKNWKERERMKNKIKEDGKMLEGEARNVGRKEG